MCNSGSICLVKQSSSLDSFCEHWSNFFITQVPLSQCLYRVITCFMRETHIFHLATAFSTVSQYLLACRFLERFWAIHPSILSFIHSPIHSSKKRPPSSSDLAPTHPHPIRITLPHLPANHRSPQKSSSPESGKTEGGRGALPRLSTATARPERFFVFSVPTFPIPRLGRGLCMFVVRHLWGPGLRMN